MKKALLFALTVMACAQLVAQTTSNVVLFTENGERFYAILNGQRMNQEAVTNLKVQDLNQPNYTLKVIFENKTLGEMQKTLYLESGVEAVYAVKLDKKGLYKLAYRSSVPIAQAAPPAPQQQVVVWGAPAPAPTTTTVQEQTVTTTTTTSGSSTGTGESVNMNVSANDNGMSTNMGTGTGESVNMSVTANPNGFGMNVNISGTGTPTTTGTTTSGSSTTTTTTTTTTTSSPAVVNPQPVVVQPAPCTHMGSTDFNSALSSIKAKTFEDSKLTIAKQITSKNCMDASQVKAITELFDFEATKLEYAKYAYDYCWEKNNYYKVNDAFEFESTIEELDAYIRTR